VEFLILVMFKRFLGKSHSQRSDGPTEAPDLLVVRIQKGDLRMRNQFITDYQPYIAKVTSQFCKRYIDPARDDEFSVALAAFNEAISQYDPQAGRSFLGFAETVIRRRLIDYVRKEQRNAGHVPYSSFDVEDEEDNWINPVEVHQAVQEFEKQKGTEERQSEILDLSRVLQEFGIRFTDLVEASPKHADSRESLFALARILAEDADLMRHLLDKRLLPIKELLEKVSLSRKTLERNRKYIIAVALIYQGPYPYLKSYLHTAKSGLEESEEICIKGS
jgi:RNA polymerase sigma factor